MSSTRRTQAVIIFRSAGFGRDNSHKDQGVRADLHHIVFLGQLHSSNLATFVPKLDEPGIASVLFAKLSLQVKVNLRRISDSHGRCTLILAQNTT